MFILVFLSVALLSKNTIANYDVKEFSLLMPNVKPSRVSTSFPLKTTFNYKATTHHDSIDFIIAPTSKIVWYTEKTFVNNIDFIIYKVQLYTQHNKCSVNFHCKIVIIINNYRKYCLSFYSMSC